MSDPVTAIALWLRSLLSGWGLPALLVSIIINALGILVMVTLLMVLDIFLVWVERKIVARFQDRLGPNRLGPWGLIQPFADIIKLLIKEDITPRAADRLVYNLAPIISLASVLLLWAVIPFMPAVVGANLNVGILYLVAVGAVSTLAIIMAGWASQNKYALVGAFRTVAQMISYEVPMVIALLVPVILARSMNIYEIVEGQQVWYILVAPAAAMIFLITSIAEIGRSPFDLIEAESEIVAGFHIEYTGMKFGLFYAGELLHALTIGALFAALFLGGWSGPGVAAVPVLGVFYLFIKAFFIYWVIMWIKYTLPRMRIDHMLKFNWKFLTPFALALVGVTAIADKALEGSTVLFHTLVLLGLNILLIWATLAIVRRFAAKERHRVGEPKPYARPPQPAPVEQP